MRQALVAFVAILATLACTLGRPEGLELSSLPPDVRADYAVFAVRCSRCHSLSRPLNSGIDDDTYWAMYVERMRRQPGSGITTQDEESILRFLHYYSQEQKREKSGAESQK